MARVVEVDLVRGLALVMILVDHNTGGVLAQATLRNVAVADASEVFVFLAGFASAAAFVALEARRGAAMAGQRFLRRAVSLYGAYLGMAALILGLGWGLPQAGWPVPSMPWILPEGVFADWRETVLAVAALQWRPYLTDILPVYMLTALVTPLVIPLLRRHPLVGLSASVVLWAVAPTMGSALPGQENAPWLFNPLAWQLAFVLGALARLYPVPDALRRGRFGAELTVAAGAVVLACAGLAFLWTRPELHDALIPEALGQLLYPLSKANLDGLRLLNLLALAWLGSELAAAGIGARLAARFGALVVIGRHGLTCFIAGGALSILAEAVATALTGRGLSATVAGLAADLLGIAALILVARAAEAWARRPRALAGVAAA